MSRTEPGEHHSHLNFYNYNFASSFTVPTFNFGAYFFNTLSLWYYHKWSAFSFNTQ
jgi:hypothetical protein